MVFLNTRIKTLLGASLSKVFWGEALLITNYLQNQSPTKVIPNNITPYEIWFGHKSILSHLQIFGCKAYALIHKDKHQKLDFHTIECIFLGYSEKSTLEENCVFSTSFYD
jgi:hypothetical protein